MSATYQVLKQAVKVLGFKKMFQLPEKELLKKAAQFNKNREFHIPKNKKAIYGDLPVLDGKYHCLTMRTGSEKSDKCILFLFGGGMLIGPDAGDIGLGIKLGKKSGADVWFPYYPLCTACSILEAEKMIYACYQAMLREYAPEKIAFVGFSSGAGLALSICLLNNTMPEGRKLPMPKIIIASSPGSCPADAEEYARMKALNGRDIIVDAAYMKTADAILRHGEDVPDGLLYFSTGDYTGAPLTHFWYGSDEVLLGCADNFQKHYEKAGACYVLHIGPGMCHRYPMFPYFPEGRTAFNEMIDIIREL